LNFIIQCFFTKVGSHDFAMCIYEHILRYCTDIVESGCRLFPTLKTGNMVPWHSIALDCCFPLTPVIIKRNTQNCETFILECIKGFNNIWILFPAWTTSARPKIHQGIFVFADHIFQAQFCSLRCSRNKILKLFPYQLSLYCKQPTLKFFT
jgi:hypothetical protein